MECEEREIGAKHLLMASLVLVYEFLRRKKPKSVPNRQFAALDGKLPLWSGKLPSPPEI